jgi:hypothetical protein
MSISVIPAALRNLHVLFRVGVLLLLVSTAAARLMLLGAAMFCFIIL